MIYENSTNTQRARTNAHRGIVYFRMDLKRNCDLRLIFYIIRLISSATRFGIVISIGVLHDSGSVQHSFVNFRIKTLVSAKCGTSQTSSSKIVGLEAMFITNFSSKSEFVFYYAKFHPLPKQKLCTSLPEDKITKKDTFLCLFCKIQQAWGIYSFSILRSAFNMS